jgi:hypothetical protein
LLQPVHSAIMMSVNLCLPHPAQAQRDRVTSRAQPPAGNQSMQPSPAILPDAQMIAGIRLAGTRVAKQARPRSRVLFARNAWGTGEVRFSAARSPRLFFHPCLKRNWSPGISPRTRHAPESETQRRTSQGRLQERSHFTD